MTIWETFLPYLKLLLVTFLPYVELRGGIPLGIALGMDPFWVFVVCTVGNLLIIFPIFFLLDLAFDRSLRISWVRRHIGGKVDSVRRSAKHAVNRYGVPGLAIFVAVPLPGTGAYAGCLAAYLLDIHRRKAQAAIGLGVVGAGIMVTFASLGFFVALRRLGPWWISALAVLAAVLAAVGYLYSKRRHAPGP